MAVGPQAKPWEGFQLEGECHRKLAIPLARLAQAESERAGPAPEIAVNRIVLLLQHPVASFEMVAHARAPVLVEPVVEAVEKSVVIRIRTILRPAAEVTVP